MGGEGAMHDEITAVDPHEAMAAAVLPDAALTRAEIAEIRRLAERADALVEASSRPTPARPMARPGGSGATGASASAWKRTFRL
jgi:hypothetical protein